MKHLKKECFNYFINTKKAGNSVCPVHGVSKETPLLVDFCCVFAAEQAMILKRRNHEKLTLNLEVDGNVAIAFSGGGIRSASYCCGVLSAFREDPNKILDNVDYISSVSGGGYTATGY